MKSRIENVKQAKEAIIKQEFKLQKFKTKKKTETT